MSARREDLTGWLLVAPSLLIFGVFFLYPVGHAAVMSFFAWDLISEPRFVGLEQYRGLVTDPVFHEVLWNTARYSVATVALTMCGGLGLAVLLNRPGRLYAWIQGCIFTSYIVSWVGVSLLWVWLLDERYGLVNQALGLVGIAPTHWLGDPDVALWALVGVTVWKIVGYDMVIYLAGLQSIPRDLYEAAAVDGAGPWARFRYVTLPNLAPTSVFLLVTSLIMTFQGFDVVRIMTQGGPVHATSIYVFFVHQEALELFHVGRASAAVTILFVILLGVTALQLRVLSPRAPKEARRG
jgi:ABC-type sugar transport system permease subunit